MTKERFAVMEYTVRDYRGDLPETHRISVPYDFTVGEIVEYIENYTGITDNRVSILAVLPLED